MTWWYCLMTASGEGPRKKYKSTRPPIILQMHMANTAAAAAQSVDDLVTSGGTA
jgi:hypothetical protein